MRRLFTLTILAGIGVALASFSGCSTTEHLLLTLDPDGTVAITDTDTGLTVSVPVLDTTDRPSK